MGTRVQASGEAAAVTYRLDAERRLLVATLAGVVTGDDLDQFARAIQQDPAYDPSWPALVDASTLNPSGISTEMLRARAAVPKPNPIRIAVVAPADVVFGLARMFQMMSEGYGNQIEVFRGAREAMAWLGAPGDADGDGNG
jgi:hypothetical protein